MATASNTSSQSVPSAAVGHCIDTTGHLLGDDLDLCRHPMLARVLETMATVCGWGGEVKVRLLGVRPGILPATDHGAVSVLTKVLHKGGGFGGVNKCRWRPGRDRCSSPFPFAGPRTACR